MECRNMTPERVSAIVTIVGCSQEQAIELIDYDWSEGQGHIDWLNDASDAEIASWVAAGVIANE